MSRVRTSSPAPLPLLVELVATGLVWISGPKTLRRALQGIVSGYIAHPNPYVPPAVGAYLDRLKVATGT